MTPPLGRVVQHLRRLARPPRPDPASDRQLLAAFAERRDEPAIAELLRRHGPLVLGVCRRVLGDSPAAEDAFQATFLLLLRKAGASRWRPSLGPWLYAAAGRIARKARVGDARRSAREARAAAVSSRSVGGPLDAAVLRELQAVLDDELNRLPERLRAPLVLCYLEGRTRDEAAAQLGWSLGTLKRRLERGRAILRDRLGRYDFTPLLLTAALERPAVPAGLALATADTARTFLDGGAVAASVSELIQPALTWLTGTKLGIAGVVLAVGGLTIGMAALDRPMGNPLPAVPVVAASVVPEQAVPLPGRDWYGDPLPAGAVARLGTAAFRTGNAAYYYHIAISPDGRTIATCNPTFPLLFWRADTGRADGEPIRAPEDNVGIEAIAFAADGKSIRAVCFHHDQGTTVVTVRTWDVATRQEVSRVTIPDSIIDVTNQFGHRNLASACLFAPDGRTVAVLGRDGRVVSLWDAGLGREGHRLSTDVETIGLAFSRDGKTLATVHGDHTVRIWDVARGQEVRKFAGDDRSKVGIALSPDGRLLASVDGDGRSGSTVYLWDTTTGQRTRAIDTQTRDVATLAFTPDSRGLLTNGYYNRARLRRWDVATGNQVWESPENTRSLTRTAFRPDGTAVAGEVANRLVLWDLTTGRELSEVRGHTAGLLKVRFTPDGRRIVTEARDSTRREWDAATGQPLASQAFQPGGFLYSFAAPDVKRLVTCEFGPPFVIDRLRDTAVDRVLAEWPNGLGFPAFSPDGQWLARLDPQPRKVKLIESATGREFWSQPIGGQSICSLLFTPDGRRLTAEDGLHVRTFDTATGKLLHSWAVSIIGRSPPVPGVIIAMQQPGFTPNPIASLAYTPDGRHLALGLVAHRLVVCEAETGKVVADVSGTEVSELAFSPDGQRLATAGRRNPTVRVWDWRAGKELRQFTGHRSDVTTLAFSLDGRRLVSGADDTTALIWDVRDVRPGDK